MRQIIIILVILVFNFGSLQSATINSLNVQGNSKLSKETIKLYGEIEFGKNYEEKDINEIIQNLYNSNFFEDIKVSVEGDVLNIIVKEALQVNSIEIIGEPSKKIKKIILENIKLKKGGIFRDSFLKSDLEKIKVLYSQQGYNFVKTQAKTQNIDDSFVNLIIDIQRGEKTKISKINFLGDKKISERRLRDVIVSEESKFWKILSKNIYFSDANIKLDLRLLENYYKSIGYYDAKIISNSAEVIDREFAELTYTVSAGNRYRINKISTNIDKVFDKKVFLPLKDIYEKNIGKYYSPFKIKKILDAVDNIVEINDLQFVNHSVEEIISGDNIEVIIRINEGEKKLVEKINIIGNTITDEVVIRGELILDEGDPFSQVKLDKSIAEIKARRIFSKVNYKLKSGSETNTNIIDIFVEEKPTGEISAGAGVGTSGGNFLFNISENNWLGKGVRVNASLEGSSESLKGSLLYSNPNYDFYGNALSYEISSTTNDRPDSGFENSLISLGIATNYEQFEDIFFSPSLKLTLDDLEVDNTASSNLKKQAGSFTDLAFNYGISTDKRDRAFKPTDGYIAGFSQSLPVYADSSHLRNTFYSSKYLAISPDFITAFKIYGSAVNGLSDDDVRLSKRLYLPQKRLRGFKRNKVGPKDGSDYVGGNYNASFNIEANFPNLLPDNFRTEVGAFLDFGNVWGVDYDASINESNKIRSSAGLNASWLSPIGPMSFTLSQNLAKGSTDETESFNFSLGTTF